MSRELETRHILYNHMVYDSPTTMLWAGSPLGKVFEEYTVSVSSHYSHYAIYHTTQHTLPHQTTDKDELFTEQFQINIIMLLILVSFSHQAPATPQERCIQ